METTRKDLFATHRLLKYVGVFELNGYKVLRTIVCPVIG